MTLALPFTAAGIETELPFAGLPGVLQISLLLLAFALALGVVVALYRLEMRRIPARFAFALLALRSLLVVAVLGALLFDPKLARTRRENVPGRVLVAVDTSESMIVRDLERPLPEKLRIVRALGLARDGANDAELAARHDALTRAEIAERILRSDGGKLLEELRKKHSVEVVGFDQTLASIPKSGDSGQATDLRLPLNRAGEMASDESSRLVGVVLLTDGRHNWGGSPMPAASRLAARNTPIFPVVMAPDEAPIDVAITEAQAQATTVFQGSRVPVEVAVRATKWPAGPIVVTLEVPADEPEGRPQKVTETIQHPGGEATYRLTLRAKLDAAGPRTITVAASSESAVDRFPGNNKRTLRVNAVKERARTLLVDGEARWEFHYLHTALGRDPNMDVRSVVFRQPRITEATDDAVRKVGLPARTMPADPEALAAYDCIILGDVEPEQFGVVERERLEKYVAEGGGTLVMVAGKRAMPLEYAALENDPLRRLLPLREPKAWSEKLGFRPAPTTDGSKSWFLQLAENRGESQGVWEQFPPHFWAVTGEPKAGAEVLAAADGKPLIARQNYGFGRVLYVGFDSTWRWRYKVGDRYHHRFWGQVAQWAASDRLLPTTNPSGTIRFGTREPTFKPGQRVEIVVRTTEGAKVLSPAALKGARITRLAEKSVTIVPLVAPEGRPSELIGTANDLPPGKYRVELEIPEWAEQLLNPAGKRLGSDFEVLALDGEEMLELSANRPLLDELATATGGKVFEPDQCKELIETLLAQSSVVERRTVRPLRSSWWSFAFVLLLLCAEWSVRKWAGLP